MNPNASNSFANSASVPSGKQKRHAKGLRDAAKLWARTCSNTAKAPSWNNRFRVQRKHDSGVIYKTLNDSEHRADAWAGPTTSACDSVSMLWPEPSANSARAIRPRSTPCETKSMI